MPTLYVFPLFLIALWIVVLILFVWMYLLSRRSQRSFALWTRDHEFRTPSETFDIATGRKCVEARDVSGMRIEEVRDAGTGHHVGHLLAMSRLWHRVE